MAEIIRHFPTSPQPHCPPCIYSKAVFTSALKICNSPAAGKRVYHLASCPENKMLQKGHQKKKKVSWGRKEKKNNPSLSRLIEWKVNFHHKLSLCESCTPLNMWRGQLAGEWAGCSSGTQCSPELTSSPKSVDSISTMEQQIGVCRNAATVHQIHSHCTQSPLCRPCGIQRSEGCTPALRELPVFAGERKPMAWME